MRPHLGYSRLCTPKHGPFPTANVNQTGGENHATTFGLFWRRTMLAVRHARADSRADARLGTLPSRQRTSAHVRKRAAQNYQTSFRVEQWWSSSVHLMTGVTQGPPTPAPVELGKKNALKPRFPQSRGFSFGDHQREAIGRVLINPLDAEASAFGSKADMKRCCGESPLMTPSGHA